MGKKNTDHSQMPIIIIHLCMISELHWTDQYEIFTKVCDLNV